MDETQLEVWLLPSLPGPGPTRQTSPINFIVLLKPFRVFIASEQVKIRKQLQKGKFLQSRPAKYRDFLLYFRH